MKYRYGLTIKAYEELLEDVGYECPICNRSHYEGALVVDHDHITNEVRGVLCRTCNSGIGFLGDDIELLEKAIQYLSKY